MAGDFYLLKKKSDKSKGEQGRKVVEAQGAIKGFNGCHIGKPSFFFTTLVVLKEIFKRKSKTIKTLI